LYREILTRRRRAARPDHRQLAADLAALGYTLMEQSNWSDAEAVLRECLAIRTRMQPDDWYRFSVMSMLGGSLLAQGRYAEAEPMVVHGYEGIKAREATVPAVARSRILEAALRVVRLYEGSGKTAQASAWKEKLRLADLPPDIFTRP
jgi:hypothetical protein